MDLAILVIDIGMTNKKISVYDEHLVQLEAFSKEFPPIMIQDLETGRNIPTHDLNGMRLWFFEQITGLASKYPIKAISITTHGATFVCIDGDGNVSAPCIFYTYEPGQDFQNGFYKLCGSKEKLQEDTYTPAFDSMINMAKGIYFIKQKFPKQFARTDTILNFPQYWAYLLTGNKCYEQTYLSCHTYLWEQNKRKWSTAAQSLGINDKLPQLMKDTCSSLGTIKTDIAEKTGLDKSVIVTAGIHDSNASLLPYLGKQKGRDFILNSTGTWCVIMHPEEKKNEAVYSKEDIGNVVFFNRSALGQPVKTAIFLGGLELDSYVKLFQKINKTESFPASDMENVKKILKEKKLFLLPELVKKSGQFPFSSAGIVEDGHFYSYENMQSEVEIPDCMHDGKILWALLDISLAIQTQTALLRAGIKEGTRVYTEGGFRKNRIYNCLLASIFPKNDFFLTNMKEATSTGAAMSALMALSGTDEQKLSEMVNIENKKVDGESLSDFLSYKTEWLKKMIK